MLCSRVDGVCLSVLSSDHMCCGVTHVTKDAVGVSSRAVYLRTPLHLLLVLG